MNSKLQKSFDRLSHTMTETTDYMDRLTEEQLRKAPVDAWNSAQILHHLVDSEMGIVAYLEKKILADKKDVQKTGIGGMIRSFLLQRALKDRQKKFKVPSRLAPMLDQPDYSETKKNLVQTRARLEAILEKFDASMSSRGYFNHPRAGRLTITQTLDFMNIHFERHFDQIRQRSM